MESKRRTSGPSPKELTGLFHDLVRLETEIWELVDRRLTRDHHLPLSWFEPIQVIDRVPDCRVVDIAEALSITVGGTSKLVDRIEQAGWCSRAPNPLDGRSSVLALTRAGRNRLDAAQDSFEDELETLLRTALPAEQLAAFAGTTRDLREHIANQEGNA